MRKTKIFSRIFETALVFVMIGAMLGGLPSIDNVEASSSYDRQAAYEYAQKYWDEVCSDGYFWDTTLHYITLSIGTDITSMTGYDCAHFVSCCIGSEPSETGGGLDVPSDYPSGPYGKPGAGKLGDWLLLDSGVAVEKSSVDELERGDVINYDWTGDGNWDHVTLYLGSGQVAAHTECHWTPGEALDWQLGGADSYRFIHITSDAGQGTTYEETLDIYQYSVGSTIQWTHTYDHSADPVDYATLTIVADDVDGGEQDKVYVNGHYVGLLNDMGFYTNWQYYPGPGNPNVPGAITATTFTIDPSWLNSMPVEVEVEAGWGAEIETSTLTVVPVVVVNQPPVADAGADQSVFSGDLVYFDGSGSYDPDGTIVSYEWSFGDGETATGQQVTHRFTGAMGEAKEYTVKLTIEDDKGATNSNTHIVTVYPLERYTTVYSSTGTGIVCITTSHGVFEDLKAVPPHSLPSVLFPHGMFSFKITGLTPGQTVTLTIEFPSPLPTGTLWWKYDNGRWHALRNENDNGDHIMAIQLTDGGRGDLDDMPGRITDPGGPGNPMTVGWDGSPVSKSAVLVPWIALLGAVVAGAGLLALRRRRVQM